MALAALVASSASATVLNFDPDWKFTKSDPAGAADPAFDDRSWSNVSLPHTFNDIDTFDDWSTPNHVGEMNLWSGRTWYRKTFTLPEATRGKKVFIEFQAVRQIAEVYLNGKLLGMSKTGFIPFGFDLTPYLHYGAERNVLAVMADNRFTQETDMAKIVRTDLPWNSPHWHPAHGGIYRNVYLYVTDPLHVSLPLYSFLQTAGPYVYATDISDTSAAVHLEVPVQNERTTAATVQMTANVIGADDRTVLTFNQFASMIAGAGHTFTVVDTLPNRKLWSTFYPNVYRVVITLKVAGAVVDTREIPFGIRQARWDANSGFYLNGDHVKLHGWGQKPTDEWPGLGAALPDWLHFFTLQLMKDAGGNFVRWGHCAASDPMITAGDKLGIIAEQPGVDGEGDAVGDAWTIRAAAWRDTIIYFRNHPSILIWEGGNQKVSHDHAKELRDYVDKYDPQGGRVYAHRRADAVTAEFMDIGIGTEGGREIAKLSVVEGEYDREESPRRVWDNFSPPDFGYPEGKDQAYRLTSEEYAVNQVTQYKKISAANHSGGANWIFSDSTSGGRVATEVARAGGEVDGARLPKEAYWVIQTMFRDDPQVHVIGHWTYPAGTKKTVYVTSNTGDVELFVNGQSLGHTKPTDQFLFTYPDVTYSPGEIKAVAYYAGKAVATDSHHTVGPPVAIKVTPLAAPGGLRADGSDIALFDVEAVDAHGDRCPTFQKRVDFSLEGSAIWRGGYNSGKIKSTNNTYLDLESGINRVAVRSTRTAGAITLRVTGDGLKPAAVTLRSVAFPVTDGASTEMPVTHTPRLIHAPPVQTPLRVGSGPRTAGAPKAGHFITSFSYSGPAANVRVSTGAAESFPIYVDSGDNFTKLPAQLIGSDYIQAAVADRAYSAVDLMEFAVPAGATTYIAHDDRLPRPTWLTQQFQPTPFKITIAGKPMSVFQRPTAKAESLTLGSNAETAAPGNMYVVFVAR